MSDIQECHERRGHPVSSSERSYTVPADVPVLPLRDTVLFPNSFMPLAVARESSVKLIDDAIAGGKVIGVFTQKDPTQRRAGPGRSLPDRHADPHPQDVQAARRQPAADRAGPRAHRARSASSRRKPYLRAEVTEAGGAVARGRRARDRRAAAQRARELPAGRPAVAGAVRRPDRRWPPTSASPAGSRTSSPRASARSAPPPSRSCSAMLDVRARHGRAEPASSPRSSRSSSSARRSSRRSSPRSARTSASTSCASR